MPIHEPSLLQAALIGYQSEQDRIAQAIADLRRRLGATAAAAANPSPAPKKRQLSAAARKRIAAAQRKRWREFKKQKKTSA